nr:hypothetical protein [Fodinicola feengrottensis]
MTNVPRLGALRAESQFDQRGTDRAGSDADAHTLHDPGRQQPRDTMREREKRHRGEHQNKGAQQHRATADRVRQ